MTSERARRLADGGTRAEASELTDSYDERCGISQSVAGRRLAGHVGAAETCNCPLPSAWQD